MHLVSYFWDSEVHLDNLAFGIELCGCIIEIIVAIVAVATLPNEWTERRTERVRHQFEIFGVIAALIFLVAFVSNHRIGTLREDRIAGTMQVLNPLNHPVRSTSATVDIEMRQFRGWTNVNNMPVAFLSFKRKSGSNFTINCLQLTSDKCVSLGTVESSGNLGFLLEFRTLLNSSELNASVGTLATE